jgi:formylglycine-generating enzyme required for sulfatase activity
MSNKPRDDRQLFLLGQSFSRLAVEDPAKLLAVLCEDETPTRAGGETTQEKWQPYSRGEIVANAASMDARRRVALVCSAGRGKTTNMAWLEAHIAAERDGKQVPFLIRLDRENHVKRLEEAIKDLDALLTWLASRVQLAAGGDPARHRWALERYRTAGHITLLLDGLDHVVGRNDFVQDLASLLNSPRWRQCPVWISGRREAFKKWAKEFFAGTKFRVVQVDPLATPEVGFFMQWHTGRDWWDDFPLASQYLLATPRTLGLISPVLRIEMPHPPADKQERQEKIRELELDTPAGVYHRAYFHVGLPQDPNSQGLLAQGLRADNEKIALHGEKPLESNFEDRVERMGLVLGSIAFHMLDQEVDGIGLKELKHEVGPKLQTMGHGTAADFAEDLDQLYRMNNHTLEFSLFNSDVSTGKLVWDNRTVRAFFAAYWEMRDASLDADLQRIRHWIVDQAGNRLYTFSEFWEFAAEMPDRALRSDAKLSQKDLQRWLAVLGPCYTPPAQLTGEREWVQWHRRMVFYSFKLMRKRSPEIIASWRDRTPDQAAMVAEIEAGLQEIEAGPCHYGVEPAEHRRARVIQVSALRMHQWPVTNRMYEAFDPAHAANRWKNEYQNNEHPLATIAGRAGEDYCPVINVTWYDAWCFAAWCGDHIFLPSELQWEHACRKGTAWNYYFGDEEEELSQHAWFFDNSQLHTHPVPGEDSNDHCNGNGLYDMHGNVWEWCGIGTIPQIGRSAAGAGTTTARTAGPRTAKGTGRTSGTAPAASVSPQFLALEPSNVNDESVRTVAASGVESK